MLNNRLREEREYFSCQDCDIYLVPVHDNYLGCTNCNALFERDDNEQELTNEL